MIARFEDDGITIDTGYYHGNLFCNDEEITLRTKLNDLIGADSYVIKSEYFGPGLIKLSITFKFKDIADEAFFRLQTDGGLEI